MRWPRMAGCDGLCLAAGKRSSASIIERFGIALRRLVYLVLLLSA